MATSSTTKVAPKSYRGRAAVEAALIKATGELLAEIGPKAMSVRDIAERAGVNHGQVHHYFSGKAGLMKAAIRHLAQEHFERTRERSGGAVIPAPLALSEDAIYSQAVVRLAMDGEIDLATIEIEDGISVPRHLLEAMLEGHDVEQSIDVKAALAGLMAMELSWASLEEYIFRQIDAAPDEAKAIRDRIRLITRSIPKLLDIDVALFDDEISTLKTRIKNSK